MVPWSDTWYDAIISLPKLVPIFLPMDQSENLFLRDRLCASDMIQIKKVIEHVYEKFFGSESSETKTTPGTDREPSTVESEDISQIAHSKIELYCNDQVSCCWWWYHIIANTSKFTQQCNMVPYFYAVYWPRPASSAFSFVIKCN